MRLVTKRQLDERHKKKWQQLKQNVLTKSPFYQAYLDKDFTDFPIMNKSKMMEHFDSINTVNISKKEAFSIALKAEKTRNFEPMIGDIAVGLSSGTSGSPGLFLVSKKERAFWAGMLLAKGLPRGLLHHEKIAFFLRANNQLYQSLTHSRRIQFRFFDLINDFSSHILQLNQYKPTIVSAPASVLYALAKAQIAEILKISPIKIFSCAEVLEPLQRKVIERAFNIGVHQIYQCTEGFLGISDETCQLTLNEENLIIEKQWLDNSRFIPIITDLQRTTQPIIRYRLDDVLVVKHQTNSAMTQLDAIEGRESDICYAMTHNGSKIMIFSDLIQQKIASAMIALDAYQINQHAIEKFTLATKPALSQDDKIKFESALASLFLDKNCKIPTWQWVEYQQEEPGTKKRHIRVIGTIE